MPFADPEAQRLYQAEYYRKHREKIVKERLMRRAKNLSKERARDEANDRKRGRQPRAKGIHARPELAVAPQRGWQVLEGFIYFSTLKGFTLEDVEAITEAARKVLAKQKKHRP